MREAFSIVDHNDGLSTDDEQNNLETTKFNSTRGICLLMQKTFCVSSNCSCAVDCRPQTIFFTNLFFSACINLPLSLSLLEVCFLHSFLHNYILNFPGVNITINP